MDTNLVRIALSKSGLRSDLTKFENGRSAMDYLRRHALGTVRPDLTILDLNLPGMDGLDILAECKRDPDLKAIPIVVFTTSQLPDEIEHCYQLGADKVVSKPGDLRPFLRAVQDIEEWGLKRMDPGGEQR